MREWKKKCDKFSNPKIKYLVVKHSKVFMFLAIFQIKKYFCIKIRKFFKLSNDPRTGTGTVIDKDKDFGG